MTHTPEQLDAIIAGLSEPMKRALKSMAQLNQIRRGTGRKDKNTTFFKAVTFNALVEKGLVWANHEKIFGLLQLGQAVRARMMEVK